MGLPSPMHRLALGFACLLSAGTVQAAPRGPAPDPPAVHEADATAPPLARYGAPSSSDPVEWTLHASSDGQHPDADEQTMLWLMNRARQDPIAEGSFLATVEDPSVQGALGYFGVDLFVLQTEFDGIAPMPPAAFDARLYEAAYQHSLYLIANDAQNHTDQFVRVSEAGFHAGAMRGNVFSYAETALYAHAGFNVDWGGSDGTGMQVGRGHRKAIMSTDGDYTNVGLALVPEANPATAVGPLVVTGNYASASTSWPDHYNRFVVGTVWEDGNGNGRYDGGEGFAGVTVTPSVGPWFAVTSAGGGYAIPMLEAGPLTLTFSGPGIPTTTAQVAIDTTSILVDHDPFVAPEPDRLLASLVATFALFTRRRPK
jgi:hypothetical protein